MIYGLDLGSRQVKIVAVAADRSLAASLGSVAGPDGGAQDRESGPLLGARFEEFDTMSFYRDFGFRLGGKLAIDLGKVGVRAGDVIVATGYGRHNVGLPELMLARETGTPDVTIQVIPELNAHMTGAIFQTGLTDFTLLEVGGQDSKIVKVRNGLMDDFATNDRCAASSGRYLENTAIALQVSLDEIGRFWSDPVDLSSTCAVFAESELIGKVVEGADLPSLCAGINWSMWRRLRPLVERLLSPRIVFAGGVARNDALRLIVEQETGSQVIVPRHPGFNGAIGCCVRGQPP